MKIAHKTRDGLPDDIGLFSEWQGGILISCLEFLVHLFERIQQVVHVWPGSMPSVMPSLRTQLKSLVVAILALFDNALKADVTPGRETQMVKRQQEQQT